MNNLVYIGKVISVNSIDGAERIESLEVVAGQGGKWRCTAQKGQLRLGDPCQVYLPDSLLPKTPEFAFMEKHKYRVKMARFLGVPSEALVMPQTIPGQIGEDITLVAGVLKYEKPLPLNIAGDIAGNFPAFIPKTDELNFQAAPHLVAALQGQSFYSTLKADGSSGTVYRLDGHTGVCSRNYEMKDTPGSAFWRCIRDYDLAERLPDGRALQFEAVGPGIQKNPLGLTKVEPRVFNLWHIDQRRYANAAELFDLCDYLKLPTVKLLEWGIPFNLDGDGLRRYAEREYAPGKPAEGVVIRPLTESRVDGDRLSFKVLNLSYKA